MAHGNSLRALVKYLDEISDHDIGDVEIPCGIPLAYELASDLNRIGSYYLGEREMRALAEAEVTIQFSAP